MFRGTPLPRSLALLATLPACVLACATSGLPDAPVIKPYEQEQWVAPLKSGLRVIVKEDHSSPQVTIVSMFGSGATSDPKGGEGLAHFVEHLAFRSKPGGGQQQYWDLLKRMGGSFNAFTSWDVTGYFTTAHKSNLHQMMQLEAWRLARTIDGVTPEVFKTEKEVVRNELRQRWETTFGNKMFDLVFESLYPIGHPLRRAVGGTHESLNNISFEMMQKFVADHYKPDNCTIVIAGDFDTEEVKKMLGMWPAELLFGPGGPNGDAVMPRPRVGDRPAPPVPPIQTRELKRHKGPIPNHELLLAWSLPPGLRGNDVLANFAASRLDLALAEGLEVEEDDDIRGAGAFSMALADSSVMIIFATLKPGADPERARRRLEDALMNAWTTDLGRAQTEADRWTGATGLLLNSADPIAGAVQLAEYAATTGKNTFFADQLDELGKLKSDKVSDFAYKWLTRERAVALYFEPESSDIPRLVGGGGGGASAGGGTSGGRGEHTIGRDIAPPGADYSPEQIRKTVVGPALADLSRFKLANGLDVWVIPRQGAPVAQIALRLRGGNATTRPVNAATLATRFSRSQCRDHGSLLPVGGRLQTNAGLASTTTEAQILSGNLANGVAVLSDSVRCRETDDELFLHLPRWLEQQRKDFEQMEKRPEFVAGKRLYGALYPEHPFSEVEFANPADLKNVRREEAQSFILSHFRPDNGAMVVFGDVTVDDVKKHAELYATKWSGGGGGSTMEPPPVPPGPTERKVYLVDRPKATQASIIVGCRLADLKPELLPAYDVLESLAGERAWALREEWGATYGIHPGVAKMPGGAADLTFGGAVENAQVGRSIGALLATVAELGSGKINERLFATKRWDAGLSFMNDLASAESRAYAVLDTVVRRWPIDTYDKYPERLAAITPASLKDLMVPCVGKEIIAIVGDAAAIRPQLEKEGLKLEAK